MSALYEYINTIDKIQQVFLIAMVIGLILPLINIVIGGIASVLHIDFDFDTDGMPVSEFFPISPMCLLAFSLVFGGVGLLLYNSLNAQVVILVAVASGYLVAFLLNKLVILPMKKADSRAISKEQFVGKQAKVTVRLQPRKLGEVHISTKYGYISYPAISMGDDLIKEGEIVNVVEILNENGVDILKVSKIMEEREEWE